MEFQDLLDHQRKRYVDLVDAIVDGDCLPLVKYWGNNAPNVYAELSDLWGSTPKPVLYSEAWPIMQTPWIAAFVFNWRTDMLYYLATACGFIDCDGYFTVNVRHAKPFESFEAADAYAKGNNYLARSYYAILSNGV